jgi:hypothetical protein
MRRLWLLVLLALFGGAPAFAQSTTVSGTITDAGSQAWFGGTIQFRFRPADSNPTAQYIWNGAPFSSSSTFPASPLQLNGSGAFSGLSIPSNTSIAPANSTWTVTVCPAATVANCYTKNLTITGATQDISSQVIPPAVVVNLSVPLIGALAYTDNEVQGAPPGTDYFNVTDNRLHVCLFSGFPPCSWYVLNGGVGTVSSFSAGNLNPLFTTSVATPTTTPALSFTLQNAAAGTVYGNPSGSPAAPSFNALSSFSGIVTSVTASSPITSSGGTAPNIACPTCVTSVSGTTNQITSSGGTTPTLSIPSTFIAPGTIKSTTSLTAGNLSANQCVQTGAGGVLTGTGGVCSSFTGLTDIQTASVASPCTPPSNNSYDACNSTVTWPHAFANTSYNVVCTAFGPGYNGGTPGTNLSNNIFVGSVTTTTATIIIQNNRGAADTPNAVLCIAAHP